MKHYLNLFFLIFFLIFILIFSLVLIFLKNIKENEVNSATLCLKTFKAKKVNSKVFHGTITSELTSLISFQAQGRIIYLPFVVGDCVKKGQILGKLDGELYKILKKEEENKVKEMQLKTKHLNNYYKRMDILHTQGAISDNDWENAFFDNKTISNELALEKEKLKYINKQIEYNVLKAPYSGCISKKLAEVGQYAQIGSEVYEMLKDTISKVEVLVSSSYINEIKVGDKVKIKKNNKIYNGKITQILNSSIGQGGYLVKILLDKKYFELKPGMTLDIEFNLKESYLIPKSVIVENNYIYILNKENKIEKIKIIQKELINDEIRVVNFEKYKNDLIIKNYQKGLKLCEN